MTRQVHIRLQQESILRKHRRSKAKAKARRRCKKRQAYDQPKEPRYGAPYRKPIKIASLANDFRILENADTVIKDLNMILTCRGKNKKITKLHIDMTNVTNFDLGSLTCLLSTLRFTENYQGNEPKDPSCKEYFETSGFLTWMRDISGRKFIATNGNNLIFEKGVDKTSNAKVGQEIRKAIKYLTEKENPFPPVYSIIQEICPNSIEHANTKKSDINWLMGIRYEKNKVCFAMCDKGQGILKTIRKSRRQIIGDAFSDDMSILQRAFDKKYQSATEDENRNKGLPRIKSVCDDGFVDNLTVITNKTLLNLSDNSKSQSLGSEFAGTFYYWEITKDNYDKWEKNKKSISA